VTLFRSSVGISQKTTVFAGFAALCRKGNMESQANDCSVSTSATLLADIVNNLAMPTQPAFMINSHLDVSLNEIL